MKGTTQGNSAFSSIYDTIFYSFICSFVRSFVHSFTCFVLMHKIFRIALSVAVSVSVSLAGSVLCLLACMLACWFVRSLLCNMSHNNHFQCELNTQSRINTHSHTWSKHFWPNCSAFNASHYFSSRLRSTRIERHGDGDAERDKNHMIPKFVSFNIVFRQ